jgi:uncharacterized protein YejL (UPF0352 family)
MNQSGLADRTTHPMAWHRSSARSHTSRIDVPSSTQTDDAECHAVRRCCVELREAVLGVCELIASERRCSWSDNSNAGARPFQRLIVEVLRVVERHVCPGELSLLGTNLCELVIRRSILACEIAIAHARALTTEFPDSVSPPVRQPGVLAEVDLIEPG